jgi:hypothetical protein
MENKKIFWLAGGICIFLFLFLIILSFSSRRKETNNNLSPTKTHLPTKVLIEKKITPSPTKSAEALQLINVKNKLIDGFKFEDITLDYRQKSDLIIVFYSDSKDKAKEQVKKFFEQEGIENIGNVKFEYIALQKDPEEPPAGFFR